MVRQKDRQTSDHGFSPSKTINFILRVKEQYPAFLFYSDFQVQKHFPTLKRAHINESLGHRFRTMYVHLE